MNEWPKSRYQPRRISLNLYSRRRPSRQNSDKLNFPGGTEETAGSQIMKPSNGFDTC